MAVAGAGQFETTAMLHLDALFQTAVQLTCNRQEAEDVLQEVYARAFESFERGVWREARVQLFKLLMRGLRSRRRSAPDSNGFKDGLSAALSLMPWDLREVALLVDAQGFSYSQTAEILEIQADSVADRVAAAREHLRKALAL